MLQMQDGRQDLYMEALSCQDAYVRMESIYHVHHFLISAINCTEPPYAVRNNDMGMFNWTGIDGRDPRPYSTAIKYFCPRAGWGYPSTGDNETTIYCQQDGTWSNDANIETCISMADFIL